MGRKIAYISDFGIIGSGYSTLSIPLCQGLSERGHDVKAIALAYNGQQHPYGFSMIPANDFREVVGIANNLHGGWGIDVLVGALDIPKQVPLLKNLQPLSLPYIGIFPVEAGPLCFDWAMGLMGMNKRLVISQFGTDECTKKGVPAEYIELGIDVESWRLPLEEERDNLRNSFGFDDDTFVVLTVADNHERKNLSKSMKMFANFLYDYEFPYSPDGPTNIELIRENNLQVKIDAQYILVTRENCPVGWNLGNMAQDLGISQNFRIFERGLDFKKLWAMYAVADAFLLASKAEGLGLPLLEAMAVGVPTIATNCTAIRELLSDGRGFLIDYDYVHTDPFGNGNRYWTNIRHGAFLLNYVYKFRNQPGVLDVTVKARKYVESRKWDTAVDTLDKAITDIFDE